MSAHNWLGKTFEGYRLREIAASGDDEVLFTAERDRDGDDVWIRTPRTDDAGASDRLKARYEAERDAAEELYGSGAVLAVRELITIEGRPALVTDRPRGRSLNDLFAEQHSAWPLAEVLFWFKRLVSALETAHAVGAAHGSLTGRAIYLGERDRLVICGLAFVPESQLAEARARDTRALSEILYRATTGVAPSAGFPYTGQPQSPSVLVEGYPPTLARFLVKRLDEETVDDPVRDAHVFRRSLDAMEVDPEFRRRASAGGAPLPDVIIEQTSSLGLGRAAWWAFGTAVACGISMTIVYMVMQVRVEQAGQHAARPASPSANTPTRVVVEAPESGRQAVWHCLHQPFVVGGEGELTPAQVAECLQRAPEATRSEFASEARRITGALSSEPQVADTSKSRDDGFFKLFNLGPNEVAEHVRYRFERKLSLGGLERFVRGNQSTQVRGVLADLSQRRGQVGFWARKQLASLDTRTATAP